MFVHTMTIRKSMRARINNQIQHRLAPNSSPCIVHPATAILNLCVTSISYGSHVRPGSTDLEATVPCRFKPSPTFLSREAQQNSPPRSHPKSGHQNSTKNLHGRISRFLGITFLKVARSFPCVDIQTKRRLFVLNASI